MECTALKEGDKRNSCLSICYLQALGQTDWQTNQPTKRRTRGLIGVLHFQWWRVVRSQYTWTIYLSSKERVVPQKCFEKMLLLYWVITFSLIHSSRVQQNTHEEIHACIVNTARKQFRKSRIRRCLCRDICRGTREYCWVKGVFDLYCISPFTSPPLVTRLSLDLVCVYGYCRQIINHTQRCLSKKANRVRAW